MHLHLASRAPVWKCARKNCRDSDNFAQVARARARAVEEFIEIAEIGGKRGEDRAEIFEIRELIRLSRRNGVARRRVHTNAFLTQYTL